MREGLQFAGWQSQGARDYQEDSWTWHSRRAANDVSPSGLLVVLADGMGGHRGGAQASRTAVQGFIQAFNESEAPISSRLQAALDRANAQIGRESAEDPELAGMGCTLVAANFAGDGLSWISVGDSPMWLVRAGELHRLNEDHSMTPLLQAQVDAGLIAAEDAARHPQRNALRSALTGDPVELVDLSPQPKALEPGDRILLASDGLETLDEDEILAIANAGPDAPSDQLAEKLVAAVDEKARPGQDNTTVVVVSPYLGTGIVSRGTTTPRRSAMMLAAAVALAAAVIAVWYFVARGPASEQIKADEAPAADEVAPASGPEPTRTEDADSPDSSGN
ncbi:MAG: protein phosphatase 2C domain-containing protein [Alphaproteobacteria bacterium]|nr:protein phosphatase 2C domain-containing protein [Alphaproteobacteria bacterium]